MFASIPSPSSGDFNLFGLSIHAYGLMIALGVVAGIWLGGRRLEASGAGTRDDFSSIGMWGVGAGILGARLYYIVTDKSQPWKEPGKWLKIWEGGLGIPGGLLAGVLVAAWVARRKGVAVPALLTAAAPAIPLAQAIGRWGNWWNQELYGRATDLPWALEIADSKLPGGAPSAEFPSGTTFHPTFLYESLWNLALCVGLILLERRVRLRPGRLLAVYVAGYAVGRFWVEGLRIDPANAGGGWRLNQWTAVIAFVLAVGFLVWDRRRAEPVTEASTPDEGEAVDSGGDGDGEYVADDD
ncbi:MAG TPA: prolipoprotein diacylglyceryl transferase [Acidimicrobiaceae bacterium]|nr:prolipoprotein diacylglyceryl transferase [Acidimicrobiaceae bacterium]